MATFVNFSNHLTFDLQLFSHDAEVFERVSAREKSEYASKVIANALDNRQIKIHKITLSDSGSSIELVSAGMNKFTRKLYDEALFTPSQMVFNKDMVMVYNNVLSLCNIPAVDGVSSAKTTPVKSPFVNDIIELHLRDIDAHAAENIKSEGLRVQFTPDGKAFAWFKSEKSVFGFALNNYDKRLKRRFLANSQRGFEIYNTKGSTWYKYAGVFSSASSQRGNICLLHRLTNAECEDKNGMKAFKDRIWNQFDNMSGGVMSTLKELCDVSEQGINREKMFKLVSRVSLTTTPMTPTMGADTFAYLNGVFGNGYCDGMWMVNANHLADYFDLNTDAVKRVALQARVIDGIVGKGMSVPIDSNGIKAIVDRYKKEYVSYETFRKLYINQKFEDNVLYIVGKEEAPSINIIPSYVFDKNTMKIVGKYPDAEKGFVFNVLSVRTGTKGNLNKQDMSCIQHIDGAIDFLRDLGRNYLDLRFKAVKETIKGGISKDKIVNPNSYYPQMILDSCPQYVGHEKGLYKQIVKDLARTLVKNISNYKLPFKEKGATYKYMYADLAMLICSKNLLKSKEGYDNQKKKGVDGIATRCPRADIKEFYRFKTVDFEIIRKRIEAWDDVSREQKDLILDMYRHIPSGVIVLPALKEVVDSLGGSDFDGDACTVHYDPRYIEIQGKEEDGSSDIPKPPKTNKVIKHFDFNVFEDFMLDGLYGQANEKGERNAPTSVGEMANHASLIQALAVQSDSVLEDVVRHLEKGMELLGYRKSKHPYRRHVTTNDVRITNEDVIEITEDFYNSDRSIDSFRNALFDAIRACSSVEGRGIDVNKTGENVVTGLLAVLEGKDLYNNPIMNGYVVADLVTYRCADIDKFEPVFEELEDRDGNQHVTFAIKKVSEDKDNVINIPSLMTPVRDELFGIITEEIQQMLLDMENIKECGTLRDEIVAGEWNHLVNMADLKYVSMGYNDLITNDSLQKEQKDDIRATCANVVRSLFDKEATPFDRFVAIRAAAKKKSGECSSFQYVLKNEYILGVLETAAREGFSVNTNIGYKAFVKDSLSVIDGEEVIIQDGMSLNDDGIVTDRTVTGKFQIVRKGNGFWLIKDVRDMFASSTVVETITEKTMRAASGHKRISFDNDFIGIMREDPEAKSSSYEGHFDFNEVKENLEEMRSHGQKPRLFAYTQVYGAYRGLIYSFTDKKCRWNCKFPANKKQPLDTRMNHAFAKGLGVFIEGVYQYKKGGFITTILTGRLADRSK